MRSTHRPLHPLLAWLTLGCLLLTTLAGATLRVNAAPTGTVAGQKLVLAFYYMWYGPGAFDQGTMSDRPATPYISDHTDAIEQQVQQAQAAGIDGFISSWTGAGTETDNNLPKLFDVAARHNFKVSLYIETNNVMQHGDLTAQLQSVIAKYANNPAFLRWNGKPVLFFWSAPTLGNADAWRAVRQKVDPNNSQVWSLDTVDGAYLDAFDGVHLYSGGKWDGSTNVTQVDAQWRGKVDAYNKAHGTQRLWAAGVIPGWDESRVQPPRSNAKVFPRRDGAMYEQDWQAAIASDPEWITITSWNEWFEGTQIEPSASYGNKYLDLTRKYASLWKNGPNACDGGPTFAQTGHSICKATEAYWQKYGGVAQFGYPISEPISEKSATDGKDYTVQYFERARFELHPEMRGTPYEVQLGLLGRQFHATENPVAQGNAGIYRYFPETGHNVSLTFYNYWLSHGGLFVNGYPISEQFQEKLADGKTYTVQYFERARFELHPENPAPYNVLLGALGTMALSARTARNGP